MGNNRQQTIMKRTLVLTILALFGLSAAHAQHQFATLQHGDSISAYYGLNALIQAHAVAVDGDIITLSSGSFQQCDISKAITIHGAGMRQDTVLRTMPTIIVIQESMTFDIPDNPNHILTIEGVHFNNSVRFKHISNARISKCQFRSMNYQGTRYMFNSNFDNCIFTYIYVDTNCSNNNFISCAMGGVSGPNNNTYTNCVITNSSSFDNGGSYINCIVTIWSNSHVLNCSNCLFLSTATSSFDGHYYNPLNASESANNHILLPPNDTPNNEVDRYACLFKTLTGNISDAITTNSNELFELSDMAKTFIGADSLTIGMQAGIMPFNPRVLNYSTSVAGQSRPDGKLEVTIQPINE